MKEIMEEETYPVPEEGGIHLAPRAEGEIAKEGNYEGRVRDNQCRTNILGNAEAPPDL